jgi:quercetin dioxygenase-like cupin family protein
MATEAFYVLEGSYVFRTGDEETTCDPGSFVLVPRGVTHGYKAGSGGGRLLIIYVPPGIDEMWRELERASQERELTDDERDAIGLKYDIEWT